MKPLATLNRPVLKTVDVETKEETVSFKERTDVTAVPAMGVVAETMVALVLAAEALRKFGGDSIAELVAQHATGIVASPVTPTHLVLVGLMGVGQDDRRPPLVPTDSGWHLRRQRRRWSRPRTGRTVREIFETRRRGRVPRPRDRGAARRARRRRSPWSSPRRRRRCSTPANRRAAASVRASRRVAARRRPTLLVERGRRRATTGRCSSDDPAGAPGRSWPPTATRSTARSPTSSSTSTGRSPDRSPTACSRRVARA